MEEEIVKNEEPAIIEKKKNTAPYIVIILLLIIIGVLGYFLFIKKDNNEPNKDEPNNQQVIDNKEDDNTSAGIYENITDTELPSFELDENNKKFKINGKILALKMVENDSFGKDLYINDVKVDNIDVWIGKIYLTRNFLIIEGGGQTEGYPYIINGNGVLIEIIGGLPDVPTKSIGNIHYEKGKLIAIKVDSNDPLDIVSTKVELVYDGQKASMKEVIESTPTPQASIAPTVTPTASTLAPTVAPTVVPTITPTPKPVTNMNSFKYSEDNFGLASSGYVTVKGYAEVKYDVPFCGGVSPCTKENAISVDNQVNFHIVEVNNTDFIKALESWSADKNVIGIGCLKNEKISLLSASDEYGPSSSSDSSTEDYTKYLKTTVIPVSTTKKIISSSSSNPINLKLEKKKLSYYINLYDPCRTPISNVEVVD